MSLGHGANIVIDNMVYYVDFANIKSYNDGETTITGLSNSLDSTYTHNNGKLLYDSSDKTLYRAVVNDGNDLYRSDSTILLGRNFTMQALVKVTDCGTNVANGIITNHNHNIYTGAGINIKYISSSDYRISCNTGTGTERTYNTYYGSTNIYDQWALLTLRFINNDFTLWVNGEIDYTGTYTQLNGDNYIDIFNWSTGYDGSSSYRPAFKISMASVYDEALSEEEIAQNYNALKGRFE